MSSTITPKIRRLLKANTNATAATLAEGMFASTGETGDQVGRVSIAGQRGLSPLIPFGAGSDGDSITIDIYASVLWEDSDLSENRIKLGTLSVTLGAVQGQAGAAVGESERFAKEISWTPDPAGTDLASIYGLSPVVHNSTTSFSFFVFPDLAFVHALLFDIYSTDADSANAGFAAGS